jgi:hypothetical protein
MKTFKELKEGFNYTLLDIRRKNSAQGPVYKTKKLADAAAKKLNKGNERTHVPMTTKRKVNEGTALKDESIPSPMLVLRRQGLRVFPDGRKVALYTNDKYNLVFTVPFGGSATAGVPALVGQPNSNV